MIKVEEHRQKMAEVKRQIEKAKGPRHKRDLVRYYNRLSKEMASARKYMRGEKNG